MYKNLTVLFNSLKFYYYYYNLILLNTKKLYDNNFFKNEIISKSTFNSNFFFQKYWDLSNKHSWYYIGLNGLFFTFKTKRFFFKYISNHFLLNKPNSLLDISLGSNSSEKNSKNLWKYRYTNVFLNFCDWSSFYRNNIIKSKILFIFGASSPIQLPVFKSLKKYDFDDYNDDSLDFNVSISNNSDLNYNKKLLLSEFFFFNNNLKYEIDIDNDFLMLFLVKVYSPSSFFINHKIFFKNYLFLNFYTLLFYPYIYNDGYFKFIKNTDSRVLINTFADKNIQGIVNFINFDMTNLLIFKHIFFKNIYLTFYNFFFFFSLYNLFDFIWQFRKKNAI